MNSAKQCVNSEPMWGYCSRIEKKKKKKSGRKRGRGKRGMQTVPKVTGQPCQAITIEPSEVPYVYYSKPKTYNSYP